MPSNEYPAHTKRTIPRILERGMVINGARTMNQAADQIGVSRPYFQFFMRGTYVPTERVANRIAEWAQVSPYFVHLACGRLPSTMNLSDAQIVAIADTLEEMSYAVIEDSIYC